MDNEFERRVRERAYYIWIEEGRPEGSDREHWEQAEAEFGVSKHTQSQTQKQTSEEPVAPVSPDELTR